MKYFTSIFLATFVALLLTVFSFPTLSVANQDTWESIDGEALTKRCWVISEVDRNSGITSRMRDATSKTVECLKKATLSNMKKLIDKKLYPLDEIDGDLSIINDTIQKFHWKLHNENKECEPSCGTMYHVFHVSAAAHFFEILLKEVIAKRNQLKM